VTQPASNNANIYGYDLVCTSDITPDAAECGGFIVLANALYRRASTPRGTLIYDPNYGYDLSQLLNADINTVSDVAMIGANLDNEFRKDPRVYASQTTVTYTPSAGGTGLGSLTTSTLVTPAVGPTFNLVLGAGALYQAGVQLLNASLAQAA
jgi:hypothetical protein